MSPSFPCHTCKRPVFVSNGVPSPHDCRKDATGMKVEKPVKAKALAGEWHEDALYAQLSARWGIGLCVPQFAWGWFLKPKRRFTADFAFPGSWLLLEIEGQVHAIKGRRKEDVRRRQLAEGLGWRVLSVLPEQVHNGEALALVASALKEPAR